MSKTQIDKHIHMGCRTLDNSCQYNWQPQDLNTFKPPQNKMFLIFGGNTTNYADAANGNAKVIERLLTEENRQKSSIYSFMYEGEPISSLTKSLLDEYKEEIHAIYEKMLKPLFLDKVGNVKEKQGIEKVLKNLVFVSHCGGSNFVNIIIEDIYSTITEKYHPSIANQLISKLQYFAYAPHELPIKNVNGFIISPFTDNLSWKNLLINVKDEKIYNDYPKNSIKSLLKAYKNGNIFDTFDNIYKDYRIIAFRVDQNIYLIPNRLNSNFIVGDHSIGCLVKNNVLEADTDFAVTAKLLNKASKLAINQFASNSSFDPRFILNKISQTSNKTIKSNCEQSTIFTQLSTQTP